MPMTPKKARQLVTTIPLVLSFFTMMISGLAGLDTIMFTMLAIFILSIITTTLWVLGRVGSGVVSWWKSEE
ncbi:MAG: hypothetical protein AMXMBFR31_10000 [Candidatus Desulfobacillus denitrificans]|nr:hypothetical protein [Candidatus Hydrogenedentota bacterium]MCZ2174575.1 hypothetical protein [Burkholderiales bacterium]